jgi:hypothetical protein
MIFVHAGMAADDAEIILRLDVEFRLRTFNPAATLKGVELCPVDHADRERVLRLAASLPAGLTRLGCENRKRGLLSDFAELFAFRADTERTAYDLRLRLVNDDQRLIHDSVCLALSFVAPLDAKAERPAIRGGSLFFIDGPGGTGKSFLLELLLHHERKDGFVPIVTASTGIASTLLPGCRTAHSRFRIPIQITAESLCNICKNSSLAKLLCDRRVRMIVIDEAPMLHRHLLECLDRTLRDIRSSPSVPFGGLVIVLAGDFRQCLRAAWL